MAAKLQYLVIHCTATPEGREVSSAEIRRWHTDPQPAGRGWKQVGYTDMIHLDGTVERLVQNNEDAQVDPWEITNGATGYNSISRHIVYVGGLAKDGKTTKDTRTKAQKKALKEYVQDFQKRFPDVKIIGHNQVAAKDCPSFDVQKWLKEIESEQPEVSEPPVETIEPQSQPEEVVHAETHTEPIVSETLFIKIINFLKKWRGQ